jgi:phage shock protein A
MALITRVLRLFRADMNAVLERIEEPQLLLKQAICEMQEALDDDEQSAKMLALELQQGEVREEDLIQHLNDTREELDLCFEGGNESLIRSLIKRKLETDRHIKILRRQQDERRGVAEELKQRINENHARLESMRQKAALFNVHEKSDDTSRWVEPECRHLFTISNEDVELALLREKQSRERP